MIKLTRVSKNDELLDITTAENQIIDYALALLAKEEHITESSLKELCPAIFSCCYNYHRQNGIEIDSITYGADRIKDGSTHASANKNILSINLEDFSQSNSFRDVANLLTSLTHESQHIADLYDPSLKSPTNDYSNKNFFSNGMDFAEAYVKYYKETNKNTITNAVLFQTKEKEVKDIVYREYWYDSSEVRARATEKIQTKELLQRALTRPDIIADEVKFNRINGLIDEIDYLTKLESKKDQRIASQELNPETRDDMIKFIHLKTAELESLTSSLIEQKQQINPDEFIDADQDITNTMYMLIGSQSLFYDPEISNRLSDMILTCMQNGIAMESTFSTLVKSCEFSPTQEQMEIAARFYQQDSELYNLTTFIEDFDVFDQRYLLETFALNNPQFTDQVGSYFGYIIPLDQGIVDDVISQNQSTMGDE